VKGFEVSVTRNSNGASVSSTASLVSTYTFNGWYNVSSGGSKILSNAASPVLQANVSGYTGANGIWIRKRNATLYAQFSSKAVTLPTIEKNGGYTCGWTTSSNGTTIQYASGSNYTPTADTTFYGVCEQLVYEITSPDSTKYANSLADALSVVVNGGTIKVLKDNTSGSVTNTKI